MLDIYTGINRLMLPALLRMIRENPNEPHYVIVPRQLTLFAERTIMEALDLPGSFLISVLSADRFCHRIFEATGRPAGTRVDDLGRVMLVRAAIRDCRDRLTLYGNSDKRRGFAERAAQQLERIRQASITPEQLIHAAESADGTTALKLRDLSVMLESYETRINGMYQDGESEFLAATAQVGNAAFLKNAHVWFFGFDMVPPTMHKLAVAVSRAAWQTGYFLPLKNDRNADDYDPYLPMEDALARLCSAAAGEVRRICITDTEEAPNGRTMLYVESAPQSDALSYLERSLFSVTPRAYEGKDVPIQTVTARNPYDECMYAAALARHLVMKNNWNWNDILILAQDPDSYDAPLRRAFAAYDVPLFLASSRSAARHAVCECLLTALTMLDSDWHAEDMLALLRTGLMPVSVYDAERFMNYIKKVALHGHLFREPFTRGKDAEREALEPVREKCAAVLMSLDKALRNANDLSEQLKALFDFLTVLDAFKKISRRVTALADAGFREAAGEESQVWNRLLSTLDQMHALLGTDRLSVRELHDTLEDSLSATVIKALPQSGDAVYAQSTKSVCATACRAIILLGATDRVTGEEDGLLTSDQKAQLSKVTERYLGPSEDDTARLRRYYLKTAVGMATEHITVSCALSGTDDSAQKPGRIFEELKVLFNTHVRSVDSDREIAAMLRSAPAAALNYAAKAIADADSSGDELLGSKADEKALRALFALEETDTEIADGLERISRALDRKAASERLRPTTAAALYSQIHDQSVTSLEMYARCPFSYFVKYGLKPDIIEPYDFSAHYRGSLLHDAVSLFVDRNRDRLSDMTEEDARESMSAVADELIAEAMEKTPLGSSAFSAAKARSLRSAASACAVAISDHMRGSRFINDATEKEFGGEGNTFTLENGLSVKGKIDRIDIMSPAPELGLNSNYLRIIDYKLGGKDLKLEGIYNGLQLQLPIYLSVARAQKGTAATAGLYYFPLCDEIVDSTETDPEKIKEKRRKDFRLQGLLPESDELKTAMSPDHRSVFKGSGASEDDFRMLARYSTELAGSYVQEIQGGSCEIRPSHINTSNANRPCTYCDYKNLCLFDPKLDKERVFPTISDQDVILKLRHRYGAPDEETEDIE